MIKKKIQLTSIIIGFLICAPFASAENVEFEEILHYSDSGISINLNLRQNFSSSIFHSDFVQNHNTSALISYNLTNYSSSNNSILFSNISTNPFTMVIEDSLGFEISTIDSGYSAAASFTIPTNCIVSEITIHSAILSPGELGLYIANSYWDEEINRSNINANDHLLLNSTLFSSSDIQYKERNFQTNQIQLNTSTTENNTYFLVLNASSGQFGWSRVGSDYDDDVNNTVPLYKGFLDSEWQYIPDNQGVNSSDFRFSVEILPLDNANLNSIGFEINEEIPSLIEKNESWEFQSNSENNTIHDFSVVWPNVTLDYQIFQEFSLVVPVHTIFDVNNNSIIRWKVEYNTSWFEETSNHEIFFYKPNNWNLNNITLDAMIIDFIDEENSINFNAFLRNKNIQIIFESENEIIFDSMIQYQDKICLHFTTLTAITGNSTVWFGDENSIESRSLVIQNQTQLDLCISLVDDIKENGTYFIKFLYSNQTHVFHDVVLFNYETSEEFNPNRSNQIYWYILVFSLLFGFAAFLVKKNSNLKKEDPE